MSLANYGLIQGKAFEGLTVTDQTASLTGGSLFHAEKVITQQAGQSITGGNYFGTNATLTGYVEGQIVRDGTASLSGGNLGHVGTILMQTNGQSMTGGHYYGTTATLSSNLKAAGATLSGNIEAQKFIDGTASITGGNIFGSAQTLTAGLKAASATLSGNLEALKIIDGVASVTAGHFYGSTATLSSNLKAAGATLSGSIEAEKFIDGTASITGGNIFGSAQTLTAGLKAASATLSGNIEAQKFIDGNASVTGGHFYGSTATLSSNLKAAAATLSGALEAEKIIDGTASLTGGNLGHVGTILMQTNGQSMTGGNYYGTTMTLTDFMKAATVTATVGTFTTIYGGDLFVSSDLVVNGNTTYANSSNTSFEDLLVSYGLADGRGLSAVTGDGSGGTLTSSTDGWPAGYSDDAYVLLMDNAGNKGITQVQTGGRDGTTLKTDNLGGLAAGDVKYAALLGADEAAKNGAGFEIPAHNGSGTDRSKVFKYVDAADTFEASSSGVALDLRVSNANAVSYFSVLDNSTHKKLLTRDALYLDISGSGTVTGGTEKAGLYLSKNGGDADAAGDWRLRIDGTGASQSIMFERSSDGTNWITKFEISN